MVAVLAGFQARWCLALALLAGLPLVIAFTVVTPVANSGNSSLPVPVQWLSVHTAAKDKVAPIIRERLVWWLSLYMLSLAGGILSRSIRQSAA